MTTTDALNESKGLEAEAPKVETLKNVDPDRITNEVYKDGPVAHLICVNGIETCYAYREFEAKDMVRSIAEAEVARLRRDNRNITIGSTNDDKTLTVYSQSLGVVWDGAVVPKMVVKCVPIPRACYKYTSPSHAARGLSSSESTENLENAAKPEETPGEPAWQPTLLQTIVPTVEEKKRPTGPRPVEPVPMRLRRGEGQPARWEKATSESQ